MTRRPGFTLLELLIVTAILSILAVLAVGPVMKARERAMVTAARVEINQAIRGLEYYTAVHATLPASLAELATTGFSHSRDIEFCRFEKVEGATRNEDYVIMEARHRAARRGAVSHHPAWDGRIDEIEIATCTPVDFDGPGKGKGKGKSN
jgi:prepilin-type N-terminal cleavage/methylation domain-containing protein